VRRAPRPLFVLLSALCTLNGLSALAGEAGYGRRNRVRYIESVLTAVRESDMGTLRDVRSYLHVIDRNRCRSSFLDLRTNCLLEAAQVYCRQRGKQSQRCRLLADVIVANALGEGSFIGTQTKYSIMSSHHDYREALRKALWRRYGVLAAEMFLSATNVQDRLAESVDVFCLHVARQRGLSWQSCVAALTWFIATSDSPID